MIDASPTEAVVIAWNCIADAAQNRGRVNLPVVEICDRTGLNVEATDAAVECLGSLGLVASWRPSAGLVVTLTPLAASGLGLKLDGAEGRGGLVWRPLGARDRKDRRRAKRVRPASALGINLDALAGDSPTPDLIVEASEAIEVAAPRPGRRLPDSASTRLPRPTVALTGCRAWPIGWPGQSGYEDRCPACRDAPLTAAVYCLVCDRWGLDWLVARLLEADRRAEAAKVKVTDQRSMAERRAGVA